jgi:hypothetical protein
MMGTVRRPRSDKGQPNPARRRSDEHYERLSAAMFRSKRTRVILRYLRTAPPLTAEQLDEIRSVLDGVPVFEEIETNAA